jgi:putative hydrolase of the HAD superfamily
MRALLDPAADAFFGVFQSRACAYPDVAATLKGLKDAGLVIGVLTDVPYGMPRRLVVQDLAVAGLAWLTPSTLTSTEVGARKPSPEGFEALAEHLGCTAAAMLFVGNEHKDIVGAKAAGMAAALIWRAESSAPAWGQDLTVTSLVQLLPVILDKDVRCT